MDHCLDHRRHSKGADKSESLEAIAGQDETDHGGWFDVTVAEGKICACRGTQDPFELVWLPVRPAVPDGIQMQSGSKNRGAISLGPGLNTS